MEISLEKNIGFWSYFISFQYNIVEAQVLSSERPIRERILISYIIVYETLGGYVSNTVFLFTFSKWHFIYIWNINWNKTCMTFPLAINNLMKIWSFLFHKLSSFFWSISILEMNFLVYKAVYRVFERDKMCLHWKIILTYLQT